MSIFEKALGFVLKAEGGYSNDPADSGGATDFGITQKVYNAFRIAAGEEEQSVKEITYDEVHNIYLHEYWNAAHCDELPDDIAIAVFDTAVNEGVSQAIKTLQGALDIHTDGIYGSETAAAIQEITDQAELTLNYLQRRADFYVRLVLVYPEKKKFSADWENRVDALREFIFPS